LSAVNSPASRLAVIVKSRIKYVESHKKTIISNLGIHTNTSMHVLLSVDAGSVDKSNRTITP